MSVVSCQRSVFGGIRGSPVRAACLACGGFLACFVLMAMPSCGSTAENVKDINQTYRNNHPTRNVVRLTAQIEIAGAGETFPAISSWFKGRTPTVTALGKDVFLLSWNVTIAPGGEYHVGGTFAARRTVKFIKWVEVYGTGRGMGERAGLSMTVREEPGLGMVIDVYNAPEAPAPLRLLLLEWATAPVPLPLESLVFGDPDLEALSWQTAPIPTPIDLSPGAPPMVMDVPDDQLAGQGAGLVRSIVVSLDGEVQEETVHQIHLFPAAVPAMSATGLALLAVLMVCAAAIVMRRRAAASQAR